MPVKIAKAAKAGLAVFALTDQTLKKRKSKKRITIILLLLILLFFWSRTVH
jgi:hypothetical protein